MKKTAGKVTFWFAMLFLVVASVFLSFLVGGTHVVIFGIIGLCCVLAALIFLLVSFILFLKDDDEKNMAESKEDAPKAH